MINSYPAFEEMFLETYSLLTKADHVALDASLVSIQQLRDQKPPADRSPIGSDEVEEASALDLRIDALEQQLYVRIRHAMERM